MHPEDASSAAAEGGGFDLDVSSATLFALVWNALTEVLGTAAVAAIVRRAVQNVAAGCPELADLVVRRDKLEYCYTLPRTWSKTTQTVARGQAGLRGLIAEIGRLLVELTGTVVINRLNEIPELRDRGLVWRPGETR
jgi:hypothetical protein